MPAVRDEVGFTGNLTVLGCLNRKESGIPGMKRTPLFLLAMMILLGGATLQAGNLIINGSFEYPNVGQNWNAYPNGQVPGWYNSLNDDGTEIDFSPVLGGVAYLGNQSMEVDGATWDTITQDVTGLTVGQQYMLSWAYGDRPGSGPQQLNVTFGGSPVATDYGTGTLGGLVWFPQSYVVTATANEELLSFAAVSLPGGSSGVGNEVDAVSLVPVPEPSSILLLGAGLAGLLFALKRKQKA
jgi:hypothetical protein